MTASRLGRLNLIALLTFAVGCEEKLGNHLTMTLATTPIVHDSGLLDLLIPMFERQTGIEVKIVVARSSQVLEIGRRGDADVLLTHSPAEEDAFINADYGIDRRPFMESDLVLVGPDADPARVREASSITDAFSRIAKHRTCFVSNSDTAEIHSKEQEIWQAAGIAPQGAWCMQVDSKMAAALRLASKAQAYTLTDRRTFFALRDQLDLTILSEGDPRLHMVYSVLLLNPHRNPQGRHHAAQAFADFVESRGTQRAIGEFGVKQYGQTLYFPKYPPQD